MSDKHAEVENFKIGFKGRLKHGELLEALSRRGWNQKQGADFVDVANNVFGRWINLQKVPKRLTKKQIKALFELTGKLPDELWPDYIRVKDFLDAPKTFEMVKSVEARKLIQSMQHNLELPALRPDVVFDKTELAQRIHDALATLPPREQKVIRERFFEDKTLEEVGTGLGISAERARFLEARALRKLRHPSRARALKPFTKD